MQALVMALRAAQAFTGPWAEALINFLTNVVIPWLRRIAQALRLFGKSSMETRRPSDGSAPACRSTSAGCRRTRPRNFRRPTRPPRRPSRSGPRSRRLTPTCPTPPRTRPPARRNRRPSTPRPWPRRPARRRPRTARRRWLGWRWGRRVTDVRTGRTRAHGPADPSPVTEPEEPAAPDADQTAPAATVTAATTPGRGISGGQVAGLGATAAGAGLLGGAAALVAARRRALQTDGSEVLGSEQPRPAARFGPAPRGGHPGRHPTVVPDRCAGRVKHRHRPRCRYR